MNICKCCYYTIKMSCQRVCFMSKRLLLAHQSKHFCRKHSERSLHHTAVFLNPRKIKPLANIDNDLSVLKSEDEVNVPEKKGSKTPLEVVQQKLNSINVSGLRPKLPVKSFTIAPYVNDSHTLKTLVEMGINLSKTEKNQELANHLLKSDFEKDIKPYILFLHDLELTGDEIVSALSEQPEILMEHLDDLNARVNYLKSKKFTAEAISTIVKKKPAFLCVPTLEVDSQLGFLQQKFSLSGNEVRNIITTYPKLIFRGKQRIEELVLVMTGYMDFTYTDCRSMLINYPRFYMSERHGIARRLDYLQKEMDIEKKDIVRYPNILRAKVNKIKDRHRFLKHLHRDQFNSTLPNYVSLETLVKGTDMEFCDNVAKVPIAEYNDFLKTL